MALVRVKKLWRLSDKLWAGLTLVSFTVSGIGIPLPAAYVKDHSIPFTQFNGARSVVIPISDDGSRPAHGD